MFEDNEKLKKLINENPDLPLLVFASEECGSIDYSFMLSSIRCEKGFALDYPKDMIVPYYDKCYTDKDELEDDIRDVLCDKYEELPDDEFDKIVNEKMEQFDPYWKECIIIWVTPY